MVFNSSVTEQDSHKNTSNYGFLESTSLSDVLQERILMIDNTKGITWYMQLLPELFSTGIQINFVLYTDPIMFGLMNIILISP